MDIQRHMGYYNPAKIGSHSSIAFIGMGAVGTSLFLNLAKLGGDPEFELWDDDIIEGHNLANQVLYGPDSVGRFKVTEARHMVRVLSGTENRKVTVHTDRVDSGVRKLRGPKVVFMCVDSMATRRSLVDKVFLNGSTELMFDIRIGAQEAYIYAIKMNDANQVAEYVKTIYLDEDVAPDTGDCQVSQTILSTVQIATSIATWHFMDWSKDKPFPFETIWMKKGWKTLTRDV